jgi:hypothetical protein
LFAIRNLALEHLDSKQHDQLRLTATDLRNNLAILHDMLMKNLEKLENPRGMGYRGAPQMMY